MTKKKNNINVENVAGTSQYDGLQVLKDTHSLPGHYLRTRDALTLVQTYYDSFSATYDERKNPIKIEYFAGTAPHITEIAFTGDSSGSLAGTYFVISGGRKSIRYAVWYSVDGSGTAPGIPDTIEVEVPISANDEASVVAYATQLALEAVNGNVFDITRATAVLTIETVKLGETNNTINNGTGFTITNTSGSSDLVETVKLNYTSQDDPIWQGQSLMGYRYNVYTGSFEISPNVSDVGDVVTDDTNVALTKAIQTGKNPDGTYDNLRASGHASSNSTTTPLLAGESYTGEWEDIQGYSHIAVLIKSDVNSALEGASAEFSVDGVNVIRQITTTFIGGSNGAFFTIPVEARYFRINYTNGSTDQGNFTVETILSVNPIGLSTIPVAASVDDLTSTLIVRAVQTGKGPNGDYFNERLSGVVDSLSTDTPLLAGQEYVSGWLDVNSYSTGSVIVNSDVGSAEQGLVFELSTNGVNVDERDAYSFPSPGANGTGKVYSIPLYASYFRVRYVNGNMDQTEFRLQTKLFKESLKYSSHRINDTLLSEDDAELVKAVISAEDPDGVFRNIKSSGDGNMLVAIGERPSQVLQRIRVSSNIENVSLDATGTVIHTVTPGYTFYATSIILSLINQEGAIGRFALTDNGEIKLPIIMPERDSGNTVSAVTTSSPPLPEPMQFNTEVRAVELAGNVIASITIIGYEEPNGV